MPTFPFHDLFDPQFGIVPNAVESIAEASPPPAQPDSRRGTPSDLLQRKHGHLSGYKPQLLKDEEAHASPRPTADHEQALLHHEPVPYQMLEPDAQNHDDCRCVFQTQSRKPL